jgi:RAVE protein 1 C terminal
MIPLHAKSYLSNDPAIIVLYQQIREKTLQTLKGATQIPPAAEWDFILRNARLYDRMGCDLLALDLVYHWEFLRGPPASTKAGLEKNEVDYRKLLTRRSSLVVADLPHNFSLAKSMTSPTTTQLTTHSKPTALQELDANSLLDSFGF